MKHTVSSEPGDGTVAHVQLHERREHRLQPADLESTAGVTTMRCTCHSSRTAAHLLPCRTRRVEHQRAQTLERCVRDRPLGQHIAHSTAPHAQSENAAQELQSRCRAAPQVEDLQRGQLFVQASNGGPVWQQRSLAWQRPRQRQRGRSSVTGDARTCRSSTVMAPAACATSPGAPTEDTPASGRYARTSLSRCRCPSISSSFMHSSTTMRRPLAPTTYGSSSPGAPAAASDAGRAASFDLPALLAALPCRARLPRQSCNACPNAARGACLLILGHKGLQERHAAAQLVRPHERRRLRACCGAAGKVTHALMHAVVLSTAGCVKLDAHPLPIGARHRAHVAHGSYVVFWGHQHAAAYLPLRRRHPAHGKETARRRRARAGWTPTWRALLGGGGRRDVRSCSALAHIT